MLARKFRLPEIQPSRRRFLIGAAATAGGFVVGYHLAGGVSPAAAHGGGQEINPLTAYVEIGEDNKIRVLSAHFEMGQGSYKGIATLVAEEL